GNQHVGSITGGEDVVVGEVQLERRHPRQRALRCPDLGREVRQSRQVVTECRGRLGEPIARQLHTIARIAGEPDHDTIQLLHLLRHDQAILSTEVIHRLPWYGGTSFTVRVPPSGWHDRDHWRYGSTRWASAVCECGGSQTPAG